MTQASTSRTQLFYVAEGAGNWGETPAGPPSLKALRFTGESFRHAKNTGQSAEIRSDGQVPDVTELGASAVGGFNFELSYDAYDDWFAYLLGGTWVDYLFTGSVIVDDTNKSYSATGISTGLVVGQYVRVANGVAGSGANNGFKTVASIPSADEFRVLETCVDETHSLTIDGSRLRNGTVENSATVEKLFGDLSSGQFNVFTGVEPNTMQIEMVADQFIKGNFGCIGKEGVVQDVTVGDGTPDDAPTNDVMNATSNIGTLLEGYPTLSTLSTAIQGLRFNVNANKQGRRAIKSRTAIGIRQGRLVVTGNLNAYYESGAMLAKVIAHQASGLHARVHDQPSTPVAGNSYFFTFPRIRLLDGGPVAPAADQDVFADLAWQAVRHPTLGCTMQIDRFPAYP